MKKTLIIFISILAINGFSQTAISAKEPIRLLDNEHKKTKLTKLLSEAKWNKLFPNRYGCNSIDPLKVTGDFYSFKAFVEAAKHFPDFLNGDTETQKRELAAFLANIAQETSGGWAEAPGGYFKWGLRYVEENQKGIINPYADSSKKNYPPVAGKYYYGRGPKQLSWNYNYGQFSEAWFGSKDTLLLHPELLAEDGELAFASALWFWMTPQFPKPSCHDIMTGKWKPTANDLQKGRVPGFGATLNVINGGVECGNGNELEETSYRYEYYKYFCNYLHVLPGENITCTEQKPFGQ